MFHSRRELFVFLIAVALCGLAILAGAI